MGKSDCTSRKRETYCAARSGKAVNAVPTGSPQAAVHLYIFVGYSSILRLDINDHSAPLNSTSASGTPTIFWLLRSTMRCRISAKLGARRDSFPFFDFTLINSLIRRSMALLMDPEKASPFWVFCRRNRFFELHLHQCGLFIPCK